MASAAETARVALWLEQRELRIAKRAELDALLVGDPVAAAAVRAGFQPLVNAALDAQLPPTDEGADGQVGNHDLNL